MSSEIAPSSITNWTTLDVHGVAVITDNEWGPGKSPKILNGLDVYGTAKPASNEYVPAGAIPAPVNVTITLSLVPPKHGGGII